MKNHLITLCLALVCVPVAQSQVSISASDVANAFGQPLAAARLCFTPVNSAVAPVGFRVGSVQVVPNEACGVVTTGALQTGLTLVASPTGVYYHIYVKAANANTIVRDYGMTPITGSTWTLDTYDPVISSIPATALAVGSVTALSPTASPTASLSPGTPTLLNLGIPAGAPGANGTNGANGAAGATGPPATFRGAWSSVTTYSTGDGVSYNSASYVALTGNTNVTPTPGATWGLLAAAGSASLSSITSAVNINFIPCTNTSTDQAALVAAFLAAGTIDVVNTCLVTGHITVYSHTKARLNKAILNYTPSVADEIFINNAATGSAVLSFTNGVVTAGSQTVTSSTAGFTSAVVGDSIQCALAGDGTYDFQSFVSAQNSSTSITVADLPGFSVNPATCSLFARDSDVAIDGATLNLLGASVSAATALPIAKFKRISGLTIRDMKVSGITVSSAYGLEIMDAADFHVDHFVRNSATLHQDGIHITGPARDCSVSHVRGYVGDDMVAVTSRDTNYQANDYSVYGTVQGCTFEDISGTSINSHGLTLVSAPAAPIYDIGVNHVHGSTIQLGTGGLSGLGAAVLVADNAFYSANGGWTGTQAPVSGVVLNDLGGNLRSNVVQLAVTNGGDITINNAGSQSPLVSNALVNQTSGNVTDLKVWANQMPLAVAPTLILQASGATITQAQVGGIQYTLSGNLGYKVFSIGGTVTDFIWEDSQLAYGSTTTPGTAVFSVPGTIKNLSYHNVHITHLPSSLAAGPLLSIPSAGVVSNFTFDNISDVAAATTNDYVIFVANGGTLGTYRGTNSDFTDILACTNFAGGSTVGVGTFTDITTSGLSTPATCLNALQGNTTIAGSLGVTSIAGTGTATFAVGAAAGTSPGTPASLSSHLADSDSGTISLTTGTATTTGILLTVTTGITRAHQPTCPGTVYLAASPFTLIPSRITTTTTTVIFTVGTAPTASTAYEMTYNCGGS